ncbi:hypothetical protein [Burkholderia sp. MSHR3999]|uniref:hypothetical protein n=1 Tax=Burkholderia sp. MSHR3999 TaxID=1542965 RepID=UPI003FA42509
MTITACASSTCTDGLKAACPVGVFTCSGTLQVAPPPLDVAAEQASTEGGGANVRDAFLLLFAYATRAAPRRVRRGDHRRLTRSALDGAWSLRVIGKGRRARTVPMPRLLIDALRAQLRTRRCRSRSKRGPPTRR